jgi:hypothetical protein
MPPLPINEEDLQPFDPEQLCPKCGFVNDMAWPQVTYCWDENCPSADLAKATDGEHLHQMCALCNYDWPVLPITDQMLKDQEAEREQRIQEAEQMQQKQAELDMQTQEVKLQQAKTPAAGAKPTAQPAKKAAAATKSSTSQRSQKPR